MNKRLNMVIYLFLGGGFFVLLFLIFGLDVGVRELSQVEPETSTVESTELVDTFTETEEETIIEEEPINEEELELLAHVIYAEAGSDWCADEMLYGVGSVVLNRMASDLFPDTMYDVIYQEGQYACTWDGNIEKEPNERAYRIAEDLLRNGLTMPPNVIFQAEFEQGDGTYCSIQTMYFCYISEEPKEEGWR